MCVMSFYTNPPIIADFFLPLPYQSGLCLLSGLKHDTIAAAIINAAIRLFFIHISSVFILFY